MKHQQAPLVVSARAVVPVLAPVVYDGAVAISGGTIVAVGRRDEVLASCPNAVEHHWDGVVVPGLVNAHTHLQFTGFAELGQRPHAGFEEWSVVFDSTYGFRAASEDWRAQAAAGAALAIRSGTTAIADVCSDLPARHALADAGMAGYSFIEVLGHDWEAWTTGGERDRFLTDLDEAGVGDGPARVGVCAHAPYSLDTPVLRDVAAMARQRGLRLHTHLAESAAEDAYYRTGTGPLADFVESFGRGFEMLAVRGVGRSATEFASDTTLLGADAHVAHGIYVDASDRALLRSTATAVALCPRSNAVIGLDVAPVADYLREGNPLCVGTDSLASSPSLDLLDDVRVLREIAVEQGYEGADLDRRLLRAATLGGAEAMGLAHGPDSLGAIEVGRRADLAVFAVDPGDDPERAVVLHGAGRCVATVVGGDLHDHATSGGVAEPSVG